MLRQALFVALTSLAASSIASAADLTGSIDDPGLKRKIDLVYVEKVPGNFPAQPATMNQKGNTYVPHILPVLQGATVSFKSEDPELHNVFAANAAKRVIFNNAVPPKAGFDRKFADLGIVHLSCNIHKEMSAWVLVLQNPFWTKPEKSGDFTIKGLPAGTYTVRIWGENLSDEQKAKTYTYTVGGAPLKIAAQ